MRRLGALALLAAMLLLALSGAGRCARWPFAKAPRSGDRAPPPTALDPAGRLLHGGRPLFPVGLYGVSIAEMPSVPRESFNVIANPYWAQGTQSTPGHLRAAGAHGFLLIAGLPYDRVRNEDTPYIETYVNAVERDERLVCWYLFEEPGSTHITAEQGQLAFRAVRRLDPARPVLFVDFDLRHVREYADCYDVFGYDGYPIGNSPIASWRNQVKQAAEAAWPKPVWAVVQAFGHDGQEAEWVLPTPQELRSMAYLAVLQGARGILFYSHGVKGGPFYVRDHPAYWAYLKQLGAELCALAPILVAPAPEGGVRTGNRSIDASLYDGLSGEGTAGEGLYLIAANTAHATPAAARHFPGVRQAAVRVALADVDEGEAELVGGAGSGSARAGRRVPIHRGTLTDDFDPYAVHIYRIARRGGEG